LYRDTFDAPLCSLICADLKLSGSVQLIAVGVDGEVRGYLPAVVERDTSRAEDDLRRKREIEQLQAEKRRLVGELRALEDTTPSCDDAQGIPSDTQISLDVAAPVANGGFELVVATSNETYVVGVVVLDTDGGLFDGETLSCAPARPTDKLGIIVRPKKNFPASLKLQIHVAARPMSTSIHVFEVDYKLPKFCRFYRVAEEVAQPSSWVKFDVPTNVQRVAQYLTQAFVSTEAVETEDNQVTSYYVGLDGAPLRVEARNDATGTQVRISTNDLATAAEVVQDISTSLDVHELESEASFPDESRRLKETLEKVSTHNSIRVRLTAEMADGSSRVKALVLKAEDARLMADMPRMMRNYDELMRVNEGLIAEYNKRATNHEALLAALKQVNQVVQRASQLRVGKAKARVVADARRAIKKGDAQALLSLIATGRTGG
jgi:Bardet-Biedl syndrome 2 protein